MGVREGISEREGGVGVREGMSGMSGREGGDEWE